MRDEAMLDLESSGNPYTFEMNRRNFLKLVGGGFILYFVVGDTPLLAQQRQGRGLTTDFNAFLRIGEDGRVACYTGKIEMGQGIITSLGQMLADELDVPLDMVDMVMGDTDVCPWDMGTFGSLTTRVFGPALRSAGAEARMVLLELASERLGVPAENLSVEGGIVFSSKDKARKVSYSELARGRKIERHATGKASVKKPAEFKVMGLPLLRRDAMEKVTGKAKYAGDIRLPGMLYGKILRPPAHDSKLVDLDVSGAETVKGARVFRDKDFVAVLHQYPDVAEMALSRIKATYETPPSDLDEKTIFDHLLKVAPEGRVVSSEGDFAKGESQSTSVSEATYLNGYVAHAPMEPHTAVVALDEGKATVWASCQNPFPLKEGVARELGIRPERVHVISPFVGGGFGGKTTNLQVLDAARLAKLSGKPVQVAYTREEEFFFDSFRPAAIVKIKSGIDSTGRLTAWDYRVFFAGERGAQQFYNIPNSVTTAYNASWVGAEGAHPFATGPWRAPGNNTNTFARESQIDIMASRAGIDPVEFRLNNLTDEKMRNVLKLAAETFGWKPDKSPSGRGVGVACGIDADTYVATVAEVEVEKRTGSVQVKRVVCCQDMGLVVNPEGAAIQMEGCIMMGLGYALTEEVRFKGRNVLDTNFDTYEIPRFSWMPKIETLTVPAQDQPLHGGGEPAIITMGAVVANAIHDAVGARVYQLPMTRERILEAIKKG